MRRYPLFFVVGVFLGCSYGERIAFVSNRDGSHNIYVMDSEGKRLRRITYGRWDAFPSWSPDGRFISYASKDPSGHLDIWVVDVKKGKRRKLTNDPMDDYSPSWNPRDHRIAFTSNRTGNDEIWVMNADGGNQVNLTLSPKSSDRFPSWSSDGKFIAFVSDRSGREEIWIMNSDGTGQKQLTFGGCIDPAWGSKGRIAFASGLGGNWQIWWMKLGRGGSAPNLIMSPGGSCRWPAWGRGGRRIYYQSDRNGNWDIWCVDVKTGRMKNITRHPATDWMPSCW